MCTGTPIIGKHATGGGGGRFDLCISEPYFLKYLFWDDFANQFFFLENVSKFLILIISQRLREVFRRGWCAIGSGGGGRRRLRGNLAKREGEQCSYSSRWALQDDNGSNKCEKWLFALGWYRGTGKEVLCWLGVFTIQPGLKKFIIHSSSDIGSFDQVEVEVDWWGVETTVGCPVLAALALSAGEIMTMTMTMRRRPSCSRELLRGRRGQSVPTYPLLWETSDKAREKMILRHFLIYIATNIIWYRTQFSIGWKTQSVGSKERGNKRKVHFWHKGGLPITILSVKCKSPVERPNLLAIQSSMIASQQRGILKQFSPASVLNFFSEIISISNWLFDS